MTVRLIKALSPAKLNLFLHVTGRRPDGRHNLQTVFQLLQWGDDMEFERCDTGGCSLESELPDVAPEHNLILRAANLLTRSEHADAGVRIRINKRIPMGGGLGGGSSNAAVTLLAVNQLLGLGHSLTDLAAMACNWALIYRCLYTVTAPGRRALGNS